MKKLPICLLFAMMVSFSGCGKIDDYLENRMVQNAGVTETSAYQEYQNYAEENKLDENGCYIDDSEDSEDSSEEAEPVPNGTVHVTFFRNSNLNMHYYTDEACRYELDTETCYLNPGDQIYAAAEVKDSVSSNMYIFDRLDFYEYDADGYRSQNPEITCTASGDKLVFTIPSDYEGTELQIAPKGEFEQRSIHLNDYYLDDDDQENALNGTWTINNQTYTDDTAEISPVTSYTISYSFDPDAYFYVSSDPECYYSDNDEGVVIFKQCDANDDTADYSVELQPYLSFSIPTGTKRSVIVSVNGENAQELQVETALPLDGLKYGDTVEIQTNSAWSELASCRDIILTGTEIFKDKAYNYRYTMSVPEKDGEFIFDYTKYCFVDHGTVRFRCFGEIVDDTQILAKGSTIYYEQVSADNGYWLGNGEHKIVVGDEAETIQALEAIHFIEKTTVRVDLPQPEYGGSVAYKLNGKTINETAVQAETGDVITMDFTVWNGWTVSAQDGAEYEVQMSSSQSVTVDGKSIDSLFAESEDHKPKLTVVLDRSIGKTAAFTVTASGMTKGVSDTPSKRTYDVNAEYKLVKGTRIGTAEPIEIALTGLALKSGKALRLTVSYFGEQNKKLKTETFYVDDLTQKIDGIDVYDPSEIADSDEWYKTIRIKLAVVNVSVFKQPAASAHTTVTVKNLATGEVMKDGALIEKSQKVTVRIKPEEGYYITGENVSNDAFKRTLLYSEYTKRISNLISKHPAEKYVTVTLDTSDVFADYTYTIGGKKVSGTVSCHQGDKLQLVYKLTDSGYRLTEKSGGFIGIGATSKQATKTITLTAKLDGTTITKESFGLAVKGKG